MHYWSQFNDGDHHMVDIDAYQNDKIIDLVTKSVEHFSVKNGIKNDPMIYLLRFADKKGKPKTDMPLLDIGQSAIDANFQRFALCEKKQDEKAKEVMEPVADFEDKTPPPPSHAKTTPAQNQNAKSEEKRCKCLLF